MTEVLAQRIIFPKDEFPDGLYYKCISRGHCGGVPKVSSNRSICIPEYSEMSTGTYFNCVFAEYWCAHTSVTVWRLRAVVSGKGRLRVVASSLLRRMVLERIEFDGEEQAIEFCVSASRFASSDLSVLFFDVIADEVGVQLHEAAWFATAPITRNVGLVVGYCTYNRENYLLQNVRWLLEDTDVMQRITAIVIADNGRSAALRDQLPRLSDNVVLHQQDNVGGTGGFARVMLEALSDARATHLLLMDDDARLETEAVFRLVSFYSVAEREFAVGGQMLDLMAPEVLYEAGSTFLVRRMVIMRHWCGENLTDLNVLHRLGRPSTVDYNAWWFFACPLQAIRHVGLPWPFFIRGDDIEFGYRLLQHDYPTLSPPGLGVWHEPFHVKVGNWHPYFIIRNMLVIVAQYEDNWAKQACKIIRRQIVEALLGADYYLAWLLCRGVEDFLAGPQCIEKPATEKIREFVAKKREFQPQLISRKYSFRKIQPRKPKLMRYFRRRWLRRLYMARHMHVPARKFKDISRIKGYVDSNEARWENLATEDYMLIGHAFGHNYDLRQRDPLVCRSLYREAGYLLSRLRRDEALLSVIWRKAATRMTSQAWWRVYLAIGSEQNNGNETKGGHIRSP